MRTALARLHAAVFAVVFVGCSAAPPPSMLAGGTKEQPAPPPSAKPAGKISPNMVGTLSPIPAMIASGEGWTLKMQGKQGMEHNAILIFEKDMKRFEGMVTFRETSERAGVRWMRLDGELHHAQGKANLSMMVGSEPCTDREGRQTRHTIRFVLGREEHIGCADIAMY